MSTAGKAVGDPTAARVYDAVVQVDPTTGLPITTSPTGGSAQQVQGAGAPAAATVGNPVRVGARIDTSAQLPAQTNGNTTDIIALQRGQLAVGLVSPANGVVADFNNPNNDGVASGNSLDIVGFNLVFNGTTWSRMKKPNLTARLVSAAASTNATSVKTSAADLFHVTGYNAAATARYLKIYNKASAPTVGTDVPIWSEYLPASSRFSFTLPPLYLSAGLAYALTTGGADNDTGALTAGDVLSLNIAYA